MKPKMLLTALVLVFVAASMALGATTGKITGVITDSQTGEPLVGATVLVDGTNLGASTDTEGHYLILNVPVGDYTVRISSVGYATLEVSEVRVSVDLATYQDHTLSSQATDIGKTITVVAERKLIIKDKTTTVDVVSRDELLALPTRGFEQVVGIQNSVVRMNSNVDIRQRGGRESLATAPEINLRGGRPSEVAYYVDGFSQQDPLSGISTANINNNAIKEVSVQSGAFSAEYGHVASGIVNVTTNSGTDEYHGNVELVSDNVASGFGYDSFDHNWYSGDFGGPIPGLENAYFFFSGERRYLGDRSPSIKTKEIYEEFGLDGLFDNPQRMPNNSVKGWSYQGKIDYNFTPNFKLQINGNGSIDKWQEYRHYYLNPQFPQQVMHCPVYEDKNLGLNAKITHTLNAETFYNLSASYFVTERLRGDGVVFDDLAAYNRGFANPEYDRHNLFREGEVYYGSDLDTINIHVGDPGDTVVQYVDSYWGSYMNRKSAYLGFKGDLTSQLNAHNTVKLGFDFQRHTVRYFENLNAVDKAGYSIKNVNRFGFDSLGNEADPDGFENETKHPINLGMYLQDRFEYRGLIVNAGLRFDYFDYKTLRLRNFLAPFDPDTTLGANSGTLEIEDLEDSEKFTRLSPRIGISFPVSDRTQMHINYGIFYQRPDLRRLFVGYDFFHARVSAGSYYPIGQPNLEPETITQYEVGVDQQLGDNTAFGITAYYKDVKDLTQIFHQSGVVSSTYEYDYYANVDYGTIKGLDFSLTMRRTRNISMNLKYSLSYATGTGSNANTNFNIAWKNPTGTPHYTHPLDYDQRHSIIGMFDVRTTKGEGPKIGDFYPLENFGLNTIIQLASGTPYTPTNKYDGVTVNTAVTVNPTGPINSARLPWTMSIDLKLERFFNIGDYKLAPYVMVKNLLDRENILGVYEGTGEPNTSGYLETEEGGQVRAAEAENNLHTGANYGEEFEYRYSLMQFNPKNYGSPRMIIVGLRMSF